MPRTGAFKTVNVACPITCMRRHGQCTLEGVTCTGPTRGARTDSIKTGSLQASNQALSLIRRLQAPNTKDNGIEGAFYVAEKQGMRSMGEFAYQPFEERRPGCHLLAYSPTSSANSHPYTWVTTYPQGKRESQRCPDVSQVSCASTFSSVPRLLVSTQVLQHEQVWVAFRPLPP